jgi:hypothetical protein
MIAAICVETLLRTETCWSLAGGLGDGIFAAATYVADYVEMRAQLHNPRPSVTSMRTTNSSVAPQYLGRLMSVAFKGPIEQH